MVVVSVLLFLLTAVEEDSEDEKPGWDEDTKKGTVLTPKSST